MAYNSKEYAIKYGKEYRAMCKRLHICVSCLNQDAFTLIGRTYCADCAAKNAAKKRKKYSTKEAREKRSEQRRLLRQRHIENHECAECGKKLPENYNFHLCSACRWKKRRRWHRKDMRGVDGMCSRCGKELCMEGKKLCAKCYEKVVPIAMKSLSAVNKENHPWRKLNNALNSRKHIKKHYGKQTDKK